MLLVLSMDQILNVWNDSIQKKQNELLSFLFSGAGHELCNWKWKRPDNTRVQIPAKTRVQIPAGGLIDCNYTGSNPGVGLDRSRSKVAVCL